LFQETEAAVPFSKNTNALNEESVLETTFTYKYTTEFILERDYLDVMFVANDLQKL